MNAHVCKEADYCKCYKMASEPSEDCPIHGYGGYPPRCAECGRYMKYHPMVVMTCDTCSNHAWFNEAKTNEGCLLNAASGGLTYDIPPGRTCEWWKAKSGDAT